MKIHLVIFVSSTKEPTVGKTLIKTLESNIRPVRGDIIDDSGFHPEYHNGYEVVKCTLKYDTNECFVSLAPLVLEKEDIELHTYIDRLKEHEWRIVTKEELIKNETN
ncbi:hypothetical protein [Metabacillus malikii]|uniref:Uncharacterized protein n=1 Tax=Metabacillus malikii TaxID=1504265 RepID=A0ABT9ZGB7_9BACI|nr:hypothetical protein [Metabacillus malikii]MDQ0231325.1 hypothetical protein [Metabacillus malikii]